MCTLRRLMRMQKERGGEKERDRGKERQRRETTENVWNDSWNIRFIEINRIIAQWTVANSDRLADTL